MSSQASDFFTASFPVSRNQRVWEAATACLQGMNAWGGPQGADHNYQRAVSAITQADALLQEFEKWQLSMEDEPEEEEK